MLKILINNSVILFLIINLGIQCSMMDRVAVLNHIGIPKRIRSHLFLSMGNRLDYRLLWRSLLGQSKENNLKEIL